MNKIDKVLAGVVIFLVLVLLIILLKPEESAGYYDLMCENVKNLSEYTSCIRLEERINS